MDNKTLYHIDFEDFPPLIGTIMNIPSNTVLYRSYDTKYNPLTDRPAFFSNLDIANKYKCSSSRCLEAFITKDIISLIDIRYMTVLLKQILMSAKANTYNLTNAIKTLSLSLGLCTYNYQLELFKIRYGDEIKNKNKDTISRYNNMLRFFNEYNSLPEDKKNSYMGILELNGIRIGETENDIEMTYLVKEIFSKICDGFIAPRFFSPYHNNTNNTIYQEILIFEPNRSITFLKDNPTIKTFDTHINIADYFKKQYGKFFINNYNCLLYIPKELKIGGSSQEPTDTRNDVIDSLSITKHNKLVRYSKNIAKLLVTIDKTDNIVSYGPPPTPRNKISSWDSSKKT